MTRYLTGTLNETTEQAIKTLAAKDAATATREGATAPWGDGETLPDVDDLMRALPPAMRVDRFGDSDLRSAYASCYDRFFREEIDRLGATLTVADKEAIDPDALSAATWTQRGEDRGQIVSVEYAYLLDAYDGTANRLVCRTTDQSVPKGKASRVSYEVADVPEDLGDEEQACDAAQRIERDDWTAAYVEQ